MTITKAEAAKLLGMKESEVVEVSAVEEGTSVLLFDGSEVLVVPADRPDAAGQSGLMLRVSPGAMSRLPVYVPFEADEAVKAPAAEGDDEDDEPAPAKPAKRAAKKAAVKAPAAEGDDEDDDA